MFAKVFTVLALLVAVSCKADPQFSYYSNPHIGAQSEATYRGFGGLSSVSKQHKAVDSPFSSVRKTDVRVTNDAVYASPQYAQLGAQVAYAQQAPVAYAQQAAPVAYAQQASPVAYAQQAGPVTYAQQAPVAYAPEGPVAYEEQAHVAYAQQGPVSYTQQIPQQIAYQHTPQPIAYQQAAPAVSYASNTLSGGPAYHSVAAPAKVHAAPVAYAQAKPSIHELAYGTAYKKAPAAAYATKTLSGSHVAPVGVQYAAAPAPVSYAQPQFSYAQQPLAYRTAVAAPAVAKVHAQAPSISYAQPQAYAQPISKLHAAPSYAAQSAVKANLLGVAYSAVSPAVSTYNFNGYGVQYGY